jgi:branched-chain amino acid transport system ATP-binding protein
MTGPCLSLDRVSKSFGPSRIVKNVSLDIAEGERHALIGPNGAGKSTLFNLISGRLPPSSGAIRLKGRPIGGRTPFAINRRGLARSFQITNIFPRLTVFENLRCALLWSMGFGYACWGNVDRNAALNARTEDLARDIGLEARAALPAGLLTYAEQRALEIGIAFAGAPEIVLLDEPTAGMSRSETTTAIALIRRLSAGRTLLIVEHDMEVVFELADRISVLVYGEILATGRPEEVRANPEVQAAYLGQSESVA